MAKTIVGLFDDFSVAQAVARDLEQAGEDRGQIHIARQDGAGGSTTINAASLTAAGVPEDEAEWYVEGVRQGGTLVTSRVEDANADRAIAIYNRHNPVDIETRAMQWRGGKATQSAATTAAAGTTRKQTTQTAAAATRVQGEGEQKLNVVEEELQVGKRQEQRGGIRVYTRVEEKPVEQQVNLREEHATVQRRRVDRPATEADFTTFKEGTIEVTETAEVPVVQKQARVVEEVVVGKEATQRTETVRDTVRRTDVEVEKVAGAGPSSSTFDTYDADFRSNFQTAFKGKQYTYDQARPAYQYGYELAGRGKGGDWSSVESDARRDWEQRSPGTWEKFKDAARYAYDKVRAKV